VTKIQAITKGRSSWFLFDDGNRDAVLLTDELEKAQAVFNESVPLKRLRTVEEVASTYIHLMTNGFITGQVLAVDGGLMLRK
jgi:NAD(P)-dependent dehydrogenase (short-subunit alcohol dehydrogenase family)